MSASWRNKPVRCFVLIVWCCLFLMSRGASADPLLEITIGGQARQFGRDELLLRRDVAHIEVASDVAYGKAMSYRAVPLAALLAGPPVPADTVIESVALDGFAAQLPLDLLTNTDPAKAVAWLAIEAADAPWPPLTGKALSAGPFYIVWTGPTAATIRSEQWPYQVTKLISQSLPTTRWPLLDVDPALPPTHPAREGLAPFVTQCLPCHTLNGAGASAVGPDLNQPMNPTRYLTPEALRRMIRNPKSVRTWPGQQMPGFSEDQMSDREIDLVIGYLKHMAEQRGLP